MVSGTAGIGRFAATVTEADTAHALGNPGIRVLATPRLAEFCDRAAAAAAAVPTGHLRIDIRHLAPTPVGDEVEIVATLVEEDDRRLVFAVAGRDSSGEIVSGRIERIRRP